MKTLYELLIKVSENSLKLQNIDGSMPSGHNGPWNDPETPVRNTSHWLITFAKAYDISGEVKFKHASLKAMKYLLSDTARPMGATFWHRSNPQRDFSNGTIGSAWTIEALCFAAKVFGDEDAIKTSKEVFLKHPFNKDWGVWTVVNVDGSYNSVDMVFNHQLWFAASGALLAEVSGDKEIKAQVATFIDKLDELFAVRENGMVRHAMVYPTFLRKYFALFTFLKNRKYNTFIRNKKELGYHAFNMHGFALLKTGNEQHSFWGSTAFKSAVELIKQPKFVEGLEASPYGYPYNPPGFEVPMALINFAKGSDAASMDNLSWWVNKQLEKTFNQHTLQFDQNTPDITTLTARLYEAARLPDIPITL